MKKPRILSAKLAVLLFSAADVMTGSLLLCAASAHAQGGVPLWTNVYQGAQQGSEGPAAIDVDSRGNVFVTGTSYNGSSHDYATVAYSNAGVPLWTNHYDGPAHGYDIPFAIAVDHSGNVFVTGDSYGIGVDYATVGYSSSGVPVWTNRYSGPTNLWDQARAIVVDSSGNVFVTGSSETSPFASDYATIKYSNAGVPLWTTRYHDGSGNGSAATAIVVDGSGNVFVSGNSWNGSNSDYATVAYSNIGVPLWTNRYNGPGNENDYVTAMVVDNGGNIFVTGYSPSGGDSSTDYATIAYSNSGVPLWINRYNGPAKQADEGQAIAVDSSGNVFVTGDSVFVRDFISDPPDYATIKYSNSGVPLWTNRYNGPQDNSDVAHDIAVDSAGNVFVTGCSANTPFPDASRDYATVAYSSTGVPLWENHYIGPPKLVNRPTAMALDAAGNVFVTGYPQSSDGFLYYATIKYSSSVPPPVRLDFQLMNNQLVLSWTNAGFNLQSAPALTGPFTNLPAATSPYTNSLTAPQQFFRLISN